LDIVLEGQERLKQHGHLVKGVVSFHGGLGRDASRPTEPITTKVLICHGANDPYVSKEEITAFQQEMRDTNTLANDLLRCSPRFYQSRIWK
jgi:dienelactone hydrolase